MALFGVRVEVATRRPPVCHDVHYYLLESNSRTGAELLACQWAASHARVVMPVASELEMWTTVRNDVNPEPRRGRK